MTSASKLMLGASAFAAVVAGIALKKGNTKPLTLTPNPSLLEELKGIELKNLDMNLFKKLGKFEKGKAMIGDKGFTGRIYDKKGWREYNNGVLSNARVGNTIKKYNNGKISFIEHTDAHYTCDTKSIRYNREKDGSIKKYLWRVGDQNPSLIIRIKPDGSKEKIVEGCVHNVRTGKGVIIYDKIYDMDSNKLIRLEKQNYIKNPVRYGLEGSPNVHISESTNIKNDAPYTQMSTKDGQKVYEYHSGELFDSNLSWTSTYDKKTGISTQKANYYRYDGYTPVKNEMTIFRDKNNNVIVKSDHNTYGYYPASNNGESTFSLRKCSPSYKYNQEEMQGIIKEKGRPFVLD